MKQGYLIAFSLLLCSCAASKPQYEIVKPELEYEIVTIEEQALEDVLATPTLFDMGVTEAQYAWERANTFFKSHTSRPVIRVNPHNNATTISNEAKPGDYVYTVNRIPRENGGSRFEVFCQPPSAARRSEAIKNARNLARFIREGTLEVSLLQK